MLGGSWGDAAANGVNLSAFGDTEKGNNQIRLLSERLSLATTFSP